MSTFWKPGADLPSSNLLLDRDDSIPSSQDGSTTVAHFNFSKAPIHQQRLNLPIAKHRRQILYAMEQFKVVVIVGETGRYVCLCLCVFVLF